jgi:hypothetical protein
MAAIKAVPTRETDDDVLQSIQLLRDDAKGAYDSFVKKLAAGTVDINTIVGEMKDMLSLQADLAALTFQATFENLEWAGEVDEDLDALKEGIGGTTILPEDATRLKATILSLVQNLRASTDPEDEGVLAAIKARAAEAIAFIDEATAEDDEDGDDEEDDEDEATETTTESN